MTKNKELINRRAFKGKFYDDIHRGLNEKYEALYPRSKIKVDYVLDTELFLWQVYIDGHTYSEDGKIIEALIHVDTFKNLTAIKLFSSINLSDYEAEYNDYSEDNYMLLRQGINDLVMEFSAKGVIFEENEVSTGGYRVVFYHPEYSSRNTYMSSWDRDRMKRNLHYDLYRSSSYGHFNVQPISKATVKSKLSDVRRSINRLLEKK